MKRILIIYPHWPPSNLAGVHRPRLISNFLPEFGWQPTVLTVNEKFYEETPDLDLLKTVSPKTEVVKVNASRVIRIFGKRLIGDIGLRAFFQLKRKALKLLKERNFDFLWIPVPSFYVAILGRILHEQTGIPYGIDYIDPWVRPLSDFQPVFSRAWWSLQLAKYLEPYAVRKASLISGVSASYFQAVLKRNYSEEKPETAAMPYGFDPIDHQIILEELEYPWLNNSSIIPYVYAGAFLPKSHLFVKLLFAGIKELQNKGEWDDRIRIYFLGTGKSSGKSILDYARDFGIEHTIKEIPKRFPYLYILNFLSAAKGLLIIGSTEPHYTASKTFQCLISARPVFSIFHKNSSAARIMKECRADTYTIYYSEGLPGEDLGQMITQTFSDFTGQKRDWNPDLVPLEKYSARSSTETLVKVIEKCLNS